jgi:carbon monoxide dehydrogenase subunit G
LSAKGARVACAFSQLLIAKRKFIFGGAFLQFQKEVEILAPREKVWRFIWDVDRFIACVPGCKEAKTLEEGKRYAATMVEKVGPFKVEFPTTIEVLEREELTRIKAQATGADNKIGSRMKLDLDVNLREEGDKTILGFVAGVDILGKLAALGHGIIKRKADQVLEEFAQSVKRQLEGDSSHA